MSNDEQYTPSYIAVKAPYIWARGAEDMDGWRAGGAEFDRFLARIRRDAAREALGSLQAFARECMFNEELAAEDLAGWHHTWAAALSHRANHYPHPDDEETP